VPDHPVAKAHARRADADEYLSVGGRWCRDLADLHNLGRSVARRNGGPHGWMRIRRAVQEVQWERQSVTARA
jgi:hypothetical protein